MANPYHDDSGKFCSRGEMLSSIDNLVISGDVAGYMKLKDEFDAIEADNNVTISKEDLNRLMETAPEEVKDSITPLKKPANSQISRIVKQVAYDSTGDRHAASGTVEELYQKLDPSTLTEIVEDFSYRTNNGEGDYTEEIKKVLEASKYEKNVMWAAVHTPGLSYEDKVDLVNQHDVTLYSELAVVHPEEVFSKNKDDFKAAMVHLRDNVKINPLDRSKMVQTNRGSMAVSLAERATDASDLELAETLVPYGKFADYSVEIIASNRFTPKALVEKVLAKDLAAGGDAYQAARSALAGNLKRNGRNADPILLDYAKYDPNPPAVPGAAPESVVAELARIQAPITSRYDARLPAEPHDIARLQAIVDSHEPQFSQLKKAAAIVENEFARTPYEKSPTDYHQRALGVHDVTLRLRNAKTYADMVQDFERIKPLLRKLDY